MRWFTYLDVPYNRSLTLVGNTDCFDLLRYIAQFYKGYNSFLYTFLDQCKYLKRVMFMPPEGVRCELGLGGKPTYPS